MRARSRSLKMKVWRPTYKVVPDSGEFDSILKVVVTKYFPAAGIVTSICYTSTFHSYIK